MAWVDTSGFTPEQLTAYRDQAVKDKQWDMTTHVGLILDYAKTVKLPVPVLVVDQGGEPTPH